MNDWQKPLLRKQLKRERKALNPIPPKEEEKELLVAHDL